MHWSADGPGVHKCLGHNGDWQGDPQTKRKQELALGPRTASFSENNNNIKAWQEGEGGGYLRSLSRAAAAWPPGVDHGHAWGSAPYSLVVEFLP